MIAFTFKQQKTAVLSHDGSQMYACTTTGTATSVANAESFGREIGELLKKDGVDAAILTST